MYFIPYGTVLKLRELGLTEAKDERFGGTGRTLPWVTLGGHSLAIVDNGFVNGHHWRFLKRPFVGLDFGFSDDELPIKITITDREITAQNARGVILPCSTMDEAHLLMAILRAFYPGRYGDICLDDRRKEIALAKQQKKLESLQLQKEGLDVELTQVAAAIHELEATHATD